MIFFPSFIAVSVNIFCQDSTLNWRQHSAFPISNFLFDTCNQHDSFIHGEMSLSRSYDTQTLWKQMTNQKKKTAIKISDVARIWCNSCQQCQELPYDSYSFTVCSTENWNALTLARRITADALNTRTDCFWLPVLLRHGNRGPSSSATVDRWLEGRRLHPPLPSVTTSFVQVTLLDHCKLL